MQSTATIASGAPTLLRLTSREWSGSAFSPIWVNAAHLMTMTRMTNQTKPYTRLELLGGLVLSVWECPEEIVDALDWECRDLASDRLEVVA